ncbi:hypothetical protein [Micromonospora chersina]|uniref:hypothetical protein n=1 Tax=Micromonospora chersina TaxID=47854 RepID=UPI0034101025
MTTVQRLPAPVGDAEKLVAILHEADEDDERIRAALRDPACRTYVALEDDTPVGAAVVRWDDQQRRRSATSRSSPTGAAPVSVGRS